MTEPLVSVVIVSYDRSNELALCLKALTYQYRRNFEIVVVYNSGSKPGIDASGLDLEIKTVEFETANISAARNLGIGEASGEIIAFIDDDAIAEPTWLLRLIEPFSDPDISASGGFVIARNGFDLQWQGEAIDDYGRASVLPLAETKTLSPKPNAYPKTHGTNCAFRRSILEEFDGFDENYHFYLDETDLNIRMGKAGKLVAIVPNAEVHHAYAASQFRSKARAPKSLFQIGASTAYFVKKNQLSASHLDEIRTEQRHRLERFVISGQLEPRDISRFLITLEKGFEEGTSRTETKQKIRSTTQSNFKEFRPYSAPRQEHFISCRRLISAKSRDEAMRLATAGEVVTLFEFSWTSLRHKRFFHSDGYWVQSGGMFGKSDRSGRAFQIHSLGSRARQETKTLLRKRGFAD